MTESWSKNEWEFRLSETERVRMTGEEGEERFKVGETELKGVRQYKGERNPEQTCCDKQQIDKL